MTMSKVEAVQKLLEYIGNCNVYINDEYGEAVPKKLRRKIMRILPGSFGGKFFYEGQGEYEGRLEILPNVRRMVSITPKRASILLPLLREIAQNIAYQQLKVEQDKMRMNRATVIVDNIVRSQNCRGW